MKQQTKVASWRRTNMRKSDLFCICTLAYNKNRDSERSRCQSGLQIILLCFTQNSTCDSWKGFPGQLSAGSRQHAHRKSRHVPERGGRHGDKDVREGKRSVLDKALRSPLSPLSAVPSLPLSLRGWALFLQERSSLGPGRLPPLGRDG